MRQSSRTKTFARGASPQGDGELFLPVAFPAPDRRHACTLRWLAVLLPLVAAPAVAAETSLAPGKDLETVAVHCSACHTTDYIRMNSPFLTRDGWKAEVTKMRTAFGAQIDDETAAEVLDYLDANYAVKAAKPEAQPTGR